jgi:NAD(P)-dependent dehydrogenase (short-subunit alcohol dehydrogenase family)
LSIGKGIAKVFATKGARVLVVARNIGPAEATANEIRAAGGKSSALAADVSSWPDAQRIAAEATAQFGGIDVLCAASGLDCTALADVGPAAAQHQTVFLGRVVVGELLAGRTNVNVLVSHIAVGRAEPKFPA